MVGGDGAGRVDDRVPHPQPVRVSLDRTGPAAAIVVAALRVPDADTALELEEQPTVPQAVLPLLGTALGHLLLGGEHRDGVDKTVDDPALVPHEVGHLIAVHEGRRRDLGARRQLSGDVGDRALAVVAHDVQRAAGVDRVVPRPGLGEAVLAPPDEGALGVAHLDAQALLVVDDQLQPVVLGGARKGILHLRLGARRGRWLTLGDRCAAQQRETECCCSKGGDETGTRDNGHGALPCAARRVIRTILLVLLGRKGPVLTGADRTAPQADGLGCCPSCSVRRPSGHCGSATKRTLKRPSPEPSLVPEMPMAPSCSRAERVFASVISGR